MKIIPIISTIIIILSLVEFHLSKNISYLFVSGWAVVALIVSIKNA